ncbi:IS5/IS1182 family transposase, partial [Lentilactobacillus buchneri]|uniref:transposase n=1 Tax=Lentilactobacillus buchneri TaxID=1581 RepID=UPI0021A64802
PITWPQVTAENLHFFLPKTYIFKLPLTDKAYGTKELRQYIEAEDGQYTIPPKSNAQDKWDCDYYVYCERHLIENYFNQLKNYRRIATRYDKLAHVFLQTIYIASILIWLK